MVFPSSTRPGDGQFSAMASRRLLDVGSEDDPPAGRHLGEGRPQGVLVLVVDHHGETAVLVIERVRAHVPPSFKSSGNGSPYSAAE
jgi:hypothetical protein